MSNTRPFTEAHAIASVDIALLFESHLSAGVREELVSAFRSHLEGFAVKEAGGDSDGFVVVFERKDADGDVVEELHIHEHYVHIVWSDYRGWVLTRNDSISRLQPALDLSRSGSIALSGLGLVYKDVFVNDDPSTYSAGEVLDAHSPFVTPAAFTSGPTWRSWFAWTVDAPGATVQRVKSTVGIDARVLNVGDDEDQKWAHFTEVLHRQQIIGNDGPSGMVDWSEQALVDRLEIGHRLNKKLLNDILVAEMAVRIGIKESRL